MSDRKLSVKHALTPKQVRFCEFLHASGGKFLGRAYKLAFAVYRESTSEWVLLEDEDIDLDQVSGGHRTKLIEQGTAVDSRDMDRRGRVLRDQNRLVEAYLAELDMSDREMANALIREQLVKGSVAERRKAAELVRQDQGRIDFSSAVEEFWKRSAEFGATAVRAYPGEVRRLVVCPCGCNHEYEVVLPIHDRFPGGVVPSNGLVEMTLDDFRTGVCWIEYEPEAKMNLLRAAGAPWSDVDPEAKLSELQVEYFNHRERTKLLHGGSGVGKSVVGAGDCIVALMYPGDCVAVIGAEYENCEKEFRYIDQGMRALFPSLAAFRRIACVSRQNYHDLECSTIWGSECFAFSMEFNDGKAALGETINHATISEAAQVSIALINKRVVRALDRALMKRPGYPFSRETGTLTLPTTPDEHRGTGCSSEILRARKKLTKNDLGKLRYGRTKYEETFWFREAGVLENPAYNADVYHANKATMKPHEFEEVYEGKMTSASGRVYSRFSESKHVRPMPSRAARQAMRFALAVDTGAYFAANLVGITPDREIWWLGESHSEKETTKVQVAGLVEMVLRVMPYDFRNDVSRALARIDLHIIDPSSPFKLDIMDHLPAFHYESPTRNQGKFDLMPTISQIGELFEADKLFIVDELEYTIEELLTYIWKSQRSPARQGVYMVREPARDHDHHMDANRMGTIPLLELGPLDTPSAEGPVDPYRQLAMDRIHNPLKHLLQQAERQGGRWC